MKINVNWVKLDANVVQTFWFLLIFWIIVELIRREMPYFSAIMLDVYIFPFSFFVIFCMTILANFASNWCRLESSEKKEPWLRKMPP